MELVERFMSLFAGMENAYGTYDLPPDVAPSDLGKVKGQAKTKKQPVTAELWQSHLDGKQGLGVVPIREDSTCVFGAVDVDSYLSFNFEWVVGRVADLRLPLVVCRSKSGGGHAYLFASERIPAKQFQERLKEVERLLGVPPKPDGTSATEIFPKQTKTLSDRGDVGNWINMPYFAGVESSRYAAIPGNSKLTPEQFVEWAETARQPASFFERPIAVASGHQYFPDGPPCLQTLSLIKIQEGSRSNGFLNMCLYLKAALPEEWRSRAKEFAQMFFEPPMDYSDVDSVIKSVARHRYGYTCKKEPIASVCDGSVCRGRKFGVDKDGGREAKSAEDSDEESIPNFPVLGQLRQLMTNPPIWFLDVNDVSVELSTEELQSPRLFQKRVMEACQFFIPIPTATSWQRMMQDLMSRVVQIDAADDSSASGMIWEMLRTFCLRSPGRDRDDVLTGKTFSDDGVTWFKMVSFMNFLKKNHVNELKSNEVTALIHVRGGVLKRLTVRGSSVPMMGVPEFPKLDPRVKKEGEGGWA